MTSESPPHKRQRPASTEPIQGEGAHSSLHKRKQPASSGLQDEKQRPTPARARSRSRSQSRSRSPPRKRKRPGAASRVNAEDREAVRQRQLEREKEQNRQAQAEAAARGNHEVVKQHYNAVPERGRVWRTTDSKIKGLRTFNNWVKSALIQKFSPDEDHTPNSARRVPSAVSREQEFRGEGKALKVLDIGCGKGGDLMKWSNAPQRVEAYVGLDPADVSIKQARDRYEQMRNPARNRGRMPRRPLFHADFVARDCFGLWLGDEQQVDIVHNFDKSVNMEGRGDPSRWDDRGFDVVSMMFCMHYAFESEEKAKMMLRNVSASLKKGGRFLGVIPNSDVISEKVEKHHDSKKSKPQDYDSDDDWDPEKTLDVEEPKKEADGGDSAAAPEKALEWGNDIYRVKFPGKTPHDGVFRPPFGWKYFYFLEEAVEEVPEYVVPWEAFRALALDFNLELQYRKTFPEVWDEEQDEPELSRLSERMGVRDSRSGQLLVRPGEMEAASFYHAFCFYKTA